MAVPVLTLRDTSDNEITTLDFGNIIAGQASDEIEIRIWNDYGGSAGSDEAQNVSLKVLNADGEEAGDLVENAWLEYKIGSENDTADPLILSDTWQPLGKGFYPELGSIQPNTFRTIYLRLRVPAGASSDSLTFYLSPFYSAISTAVDRVLYELSEDGVISEEGNADFEVKSGLYITADGSDTVTVQPGYFYHNGILKKSDGGSVQLNQQDGEGNPLDNTYTVYGAVISLTPDGTVNVTKGTRQESEPAYPSVPDGELLLGYVDVLYQEGGTSVIEQGNIDWQVSGCEFMLTDQSTVSSLMVLIGPGRCVVNGKYVERGSSEQITIEADSEKRISVNDEGLIVQDTTGDVLDLYHLVAAGTDLSIYDLRHFVGSEGFWCTAETDITKGQAVVPTELSVASSATVDSDTRVLGIAEHDAFADEKLFVLNQGKCLALLTGTYSLGDVLVADTSGSLKSDNSADAKAKIAVALEGGTLPGYAYVLLD